MSGNAQILLVGFGNMGQALVRGWLGCGHTADAIRVVDPSPEALAAAAGLGVEASAGPDLRSAMTTDVVVVAVKPAQAAQTVAGYRALAGRAVFLSIVAGKPIAFFTGILGAAAVVRAMPNTPAAIGQGMTVLCPNAAVTQAQRALCGELLAAVGSIAWVDDEDLMDAVTAVSGSGPAYVFLLIEALIAGGQALGLKPELARQLAEATVAGAGAYALGNEHGAAELRRRVTSPGGTTEAALSVLTSDPGLVELIGRALRRAAERSRELSTE